MSTAQSTLNAGGLASAKAKVDKNSSEEVVARTYRHPALGDRPVIRLASSRLGQAEDLAMEFLGFEPPQVSEPVAVQQRRSLGFASWALVNDPDNARYALDLVKRMKAADRKAKSKPGHAWEMFDALSKELGRSVRHFLPPFWEEVGRTYKELGNQTYAGRALNKSLEAERVHALESDRLRRRDVILEFVLAGCLAGKALSDYTNDLKSQYPPREAYEIFRDLCVRRTRGGMAPWANLPKDFLKLAKAADVDADAELEAWLEEVIETPAMGRAAYQFWKNCDKHCRRIVRRNPAFAMALLRHTRPEERYWGESKLWPWLDLLDQWGVLDFLWQEGHQGAPPLGEPVAVWFGRIVREDLPVPKRVLDMLERLTPRLKQEQTPLPLSMQARYRCRNVDVDVLETCLDLGIAVEDLPREAEIDFNGWLMADPDHEFRNRDLVLAPQDERFASAVAKGLAEALTCKGEAMNRGYRVEEFHRRPFPEAAGEREGIFQQWHAHALRVIGQLENTGLASFIQALEELKATFWPETLRHFPDVAERLAAIDPAEVLQKTLQSGILDEYGWPEFEALAEQVGVPIVLDHYSNNTGSLTFPRAALWNKTHAFVLGRDGKITKHELRLPSKSELLYAVALGDDVAVVFRNERWDRQFYWLSNPSQKYDATYGFLDSVGMRETVLEDGSLFYGKHAVRPGDAKEPQGQMPYFHDGQRFWGVEWAEDDQGYRTIPRLQEIDPQTGKRGRASVPSWFESPDGEALEFHSCQLFPAPKAAEASPLGCSQAMVGWKVVRRRDGTLSGEGIDGRRWDKPLTGESGESLVPEGMLQRIGAPGYLPIGRTNGRSRGQHWLYDPEGTTAVAEFSEHQSPFACGQVAILPLEFWHLLTPRHEPTSQKLRSISTTDCGALLEAAAVTAPKKKSSSRSALPKQVAIALQAWRGIKPADDSEQAEPSAQLLAKIEKLFPQIPSRFAVGVAGIVHLAELHRTELVEFREMLESESTNNSGSSNVRNQKVDAAAQMWDLPTIYLYGQEGSLSQHLLATAAFLQGEQGPGMLPSVDACWFDLLDDLPLKAWQAYWRVQGTRFEKKEDRERPWRDVLTFWNKLEFDKLPGRFDRLVARKKQKKGSSTALDEDSESHARAVVNGSDRFIILLTGHYGDSTYQILRYSTAKKPTTPPGFVIESEHPLVPQGKAEEFEAFFQAIDAAEQLPVPTPEQLAELAAQVGTSPAEIGLIWIGGLNVDSYETNFLPAAIRNALGMKATDAKAARQSLTNLNAEVRQQLFHAVVSQGLTAPFAEDRTPVLEALRQAWDAHMPKRIPLDAEHQRRLSALAKENRWGQIDHEHVLAAATDPYKHPGLQVHPCEIKLKSKSHYERLALEGKGKGEPVSWSLLRTLAQLVATVHSDAPLGHPARASVPPLVERLVETVEHEDLVWELRCTRFYEEKAPKPTAWVNQHLGKASAGKDRVARFDDGFVLAGAYDAESSLLLAYRVSKVRSGEDMQRLRGLMSIDEDPYGTRDEALPVISLLRSAGFQQLTKVMVNDQAAVDVWPQNALHSAPDVLSAVQKKLKLSEDAALLYLQTLALPDPTTANVRKWNAWTAARLKKAAAELVAKELVLEAKRARAGRSHFLPGEWLELKTPWLPIETWKIPLLADLQLDGGSPMPLGGPLVLRPYEDLFQAAWQRVCEGDEPCYEEVGKKVKKPAKAKA